MRKGGACGESEMFFQSAQRQTRCARLEHSPSVSIALQANFNARSDLSGATAKSSSAQHHFLALYVRRALISLLCARGMNCSLLIMRQIPPLFWGALLARLLINSFSSCTHTERDFFFSKYLSPWQSVRWSECLQTLLCCT
jgi:hypothetical protein